MGSGSVTALVHAVLITSAVYAGRNASRVDASVHADTTMVFLDAQRPQTVAPVALDVPLQGFQTINVPMDVPSGIPAVDLTQHFDVKDYSGVGLEGGHANGAPPAASNLYSEATVEERPTLLTPPVYPDVMRMAGIRGRVVVEAVVDSAGRVEPNSIKILKSPNPGFDEPTRQWAIKARFRPARLGGRAVRVLVNLPIDFQTTGG